MLSLLGTATLADVPESKSKRSRYTPPQPKKRPPSPTWYVVLVLGMFGVAIAIIILNYFSLLGGETNNLFLFVGLGIILVAFLLTIRLR